MGFTPEETAQMAMRLLLADTIIKETYEHMMALHARVGMADTDSEKGQVVQEWLDELGFPKAESIPTE